MVTGRRLGLAALAATLLAGCGGDDTERDVVRGRGRKLAGLAPAAEARVDEAALAAAFERGPDLTLLLHPRRLPRTAADTGAAPVRAPLLAALRERRVVQGSCEPVADGERDTPRCPVDGTGYVVRVSDVFRVSPDTVEVYLAAERYGPRTGAKPEALRFEKVYQLVERGGAWRVAREARSPAETP